MCLLSCVISLTVDPGLLEDSPSPPVRGETLGLERAPTGCAVVPNKLQSHLGIDRKYYFCTYVWIASRLQEATDLWSRRSGSGLTYRHSTYHLRSNFEVKVDCHVCLASILWCGSVRLWNVPCSSAGCRHLQKCHFAFRILAHTLASMEKRFLWNSMPLRIVSNWTVDRDASR